MIESPGDKARGAFNIKAVVRGVRNRLGDESKETKLVLAWLADACHATETVARGTPEDTWRAIGRREVWLMLQDVLRISEADLRDTQDQVGEWRQE